MLCDFDLILIQEVFVGIIVVGLISSGGFDV